MDFIPGLTLNRSFYFEAVKPLLDRAFPGLSYSASLLGYGSDVLGLDNRTSMDHNWGPRFTLFLDDRDWGRKDDIDRFLRNSLPFEFESFPVNFTDPRYDGTRTMEFKDSYPLRHLIEIVNFAGYFREQLSLDNPEEISPADWLSFKDQVLLELTSGEVFYDGLGKLNPIRTGLQFYPEDVLKVKLASLWLSLSNEEAFIGRCIEVGDFIGLKLIAGRIASTIMKISFYLEGRYIPYSKWFGTLFGRTENARVLLPLISSVLRENEMVPLQEKLCELYEAIVDLHNRTEGLPPLDNTVCPYFGRPYKVISEERIVKKLIDSVGDEGLRKIDLNGVALDIKIESVDTTG